MYILEGKTAVPCSNVMKWGRWFEDNGIRRRVGEDVIGEARVSTVFLGIDHSFVVGPPMLFETMIFGGEHDQYQQRYSTWDEAETSHKKIVQALRDGKSPDDASPD